MYITKTMFTIYSHMVINSITAWVELIILDARVAYTKGESLKNSIKKNLLVQLNSYEKFCNHFRLPYFPADNKQINRFGQFLARTFKSPDTVGNYQSAVRTFLALLGLPIPNSQDKEAQMFTQGMKRVLDHEVKQAAPMTPEILLRMNRVVDYTSQIDMVAWVATLIRFTMFLRKSNLVPDTMITFNPTMQFTRQDFNVTGPASVMMAEITWAKNLQFKQKILRIPVLPVENKAICPVMWMHFMMAQVPAGPQDPAFTIWVRGEKLALSANQLVARMRKWLKLIKEDDEEYSLHSLRRGGATFAYQCNIEGEMIKHLGNWASEAYKRYIDVSMDERYDSMKAFVEGLNKITKP